MSYDAAASDYLKAAERAQALASFAGLNPERAEQLASERFGSDWDGLGIVAWPQRALNAALEEFRPERRDEIVSQLRPLVEQQAQREAPDPRPAAHLAAVERAAWPDAEELAAGRRVLAAVTLRRVREAVARDLDLAEARRGAAHALARLRTVDRAQQAVEALAGPVGAPEFRREDVQALEAVERLVVRVAEPETKAEAAPAPPKRRGLLSALGAAL